MFVVVSREVVCLGGHLYIHNLHFTDPLFERSRTEYEIGQYNTIKEIRLHNTSIIHGPQ